VKDIICTNHVILSLMQNKLSQEDLAIVEEILLRPFGIIPVTLSPPHIQLPSPSNKLTSGGSITYKNKHRKIHNGPNGGKYIILNKKKIYISKQLNLQCK
jgi:hypothetical protein